MKSLIAAVLSIGLGAAAASAEPAAQLPDFELRDQYDAAREYTFPRSKVAVITVADHKGSDQLEPWIAPVHERYGTRIDIDGIADVSIIARPFHGIFRSAFKDRLTRSVMLDWEGEIVRQFDSRRSVANVYVIDRQGRVRARFWGPASPTRLRELFREIDRALSRSSAR